MKVDDARQSLFEFVGGVDEVGDAGEDDAVVHRSVVEAGGVDEVNLVVDFMVAVIQNVVFDILRHFDKSVSADETLRPRVGKPPPSMSSSVPISMLSSPVTVDIKVLFPAPVRPMTRM